MLLKTYQKTTTLFKEHHGYMSFADLRDHQVTVLQLAEMEEEGSLERFHAAGTGARTVVMKNRKTINISKLRK